MQRLLTIIVLILLSLIQCETNIDFYAELYSTRFEYFSQKTLTTHSDQYNIAYSNIQAIRQSQTITKYLNDFKFTNISYAIIFDFTITLPLKRLMILENVIVEHTFKQFTFVEQSDRTFKTTIDDDRHNCSILMMDIFEFDALSQLKQYKTVICDQLTSIIASKVIKFSDHIPPNVEYLNFQDLIIRVIEDSRRRATQCDYQLDTNHRLLDYTITDISYTDQNLYYDYSTFFITKISFTYHLMDEMKMITQDKDYVVFDEVNFGKKFKDNQGKSQHIKFSKVIIGNALFVSLIQRELIKYEATRNWLEN